MRIAIVSKADSYGGGASKCAQELTSLLQRKGISATHFCAWSGIGYNNNRLPLYGRFQKTGLRVHYVSKRLGLPELLPFEILTFIRRKRYKQYDLFHFHDLSSAISPYTLLLLSRFRPVVWTIHDCSPFTAGCLYPMECEKFMATCTDCPQIGEWPLDNQFVFTKYLQKIKKKIHENGNIRCITPSDWMADTAIKASVVSRRPKVINNGVNVDTYRFHDKIRVKKELGVPVDKTSILLSAGNLDDSRKGVEYALKGLYSIQDKNPHVLLMGVPSPKLERQLNGLGLTFTSFGYVSDPIELSRRYAAADFFLFCSLADNQPLAVLEALASGTPVIGFATGGVPELIEQNETGFLVPPKDIHALSKALSFAVDEAPLYDWSMSAREAAVTNFSCERFVNEHIQLYGQIHCN